MRTHYIFEDDPRDDIQRLFSVAYGGYGNTPSNMHWASGASKIESIMEDIYKVVGIDISVFDKNKRKKLRGAKKEELKKLREICEKQLAEHNSSEDQIEIYIFMDLVPDNPNTANIYNRLKFLKQKGCNILIFPIPCSEYYMIKTLCKFRIMEETEDVKTVLNREVYYDSKLFDLGDTEKTKRYIDNFEKFCKRVLATSQRKCTHKSNDEDRKHHNLKGRFYRDSCSSCTDCEMEYTIERKSEELLASYPCFPEKAVITFYNKVRNLSRDECIKLHRFLVDEYNSAVVRYRGYSGASKIERQQIIAYREIDYLE